VLFDAVAVILSDEGAKALSMESAAIDFVRDAFGHLKAIAVDKGGQDTPMGPGKVRPNIGITASSVELDGRGGDGSVPILAARVDKAFVTRSSSIHV
jgi:hypothetical protein